MAQHNRFDLTNRVAWVIGGAGYLGTAVSTGLAEHGARLILADKRAEAAEAAVSTLRATGLEASPMTLDIADEAAINTAADQIIASHGRIDVLVNLTTYTTGKPLEQMTADDFNAGLRVTLTGAFLVSRAAGQIMCRQDRPGGSIIQFGSMYGTVSPDPSMYAPKHSINPIDYGCAKAGILQMVRYQAVMWGSKNVRVNALVPGPFPNPAGHGADAVFTAKLACKVPMGRVGRSDEIVGAVIFLASDASSYVTGTQIVIDGGWTAW